MTLELLSTGHIKATEKEDNAGTPQKIICGKCEQWASLQVWYS